MKEYKRRKKNRKLPANTFPPICIIIATGSEPISREILHFYQVGNSARILVFWFGGILPRFLYTSMGVPFLDFSSDFSTEYWILLLDEISKVDPYVRQTHPLKWHTRSIPRIGSAPPGILKTKNIPYPSIEGSTPA